MNAVGQRTGISMDTLAKSMVTNSAALQQLGFSASDAANFLGNVEISGADTSQVMTGLTKALATATANGKPMKEALKEIQDSMVNASSETEGLVSIFTTVWETIKNVLTVALMFIVELIKGYNKNPNDKIYMMMNRKDVEAYQKSYDERQMKTSLKKNKKFWSAALAVIVKALSVGSFL